MFTCWYELFSSPLLHFYYWPSLQAAVIEDEQMFVLRDTEDNDEDAASGSGDQTRSNKSQVR